MILCVFLGGGVGVHVIAGHNLKRNTETFLMNLRAEQKPM